MNRIERNKRMQDSVLAGYTVGWVHGDGESNASLHDEDGDLIVELRPDIVEVIDSANDVNALTIVLTIAQSCTLVAGKAFDRGQQSGKRAGRAEIVGTVHDLLGIKRLEEALSTIEVAMREHTS